MEAFKIAVCGIICAVLALTVRTQKPEMAPAVTVAAGVILFLYISESIKFVIDNFSGVLNMCGVKAEYFYTVVKLIAVSYITSFSAETCRDCNEGAIAAKVELAGKIAVLALTAPIISDFLMLIAETLNAI